MVIEQSKTSSNPAIEVFLTVYDRLDYIRGCIDSVLAQRREDFVLTILDDGGLLEIREIIATYDDPRVRHFVNSPRKGVAASLFDGIRNSTCQYFSIINDDDLWKPMFLEVLVGALDRSNQACLAFCSHDIISADGIADVSAADKCDHIYRRAGLRQGLLDNLPELVLYSNTIPMAMGTVVRRSQVNLDLLDVAAGKHYDYWLSLVLANCSIWAYFSPERLSCYRIHSAMESVQKSVSMNDDMYKLYGAAITHKILADHGKVIRFRRRHLLLQRIRARIAGLARGFK